MDARILNLPFSPGSMLVGGDVTHQADTLTAFVVRGHGDNAATAYQTAVEAITAGPALTGPDLVAACAAALAGSDAAAELVHVHVGPEELTLTAVGGGGAAIGGEVVAGPGWREIRYLRDAVTAAIRNQLGRSFEEVEERLGRLLDPQRPELLNGLSLATGQADAFYDWLVGELGRVFGWSKIRISDVVYPACAAVKSKELWRPARINPGDFTERDVLTLTRPRTAAGSFVLWHGFRPRTVAPGPLWAPVFSQVADIANLEPAAPSSPQAAVMVWNLEAGALYRHD